jgi:hypothetical protein
MSMPPEPPAPHEPPERAKSKRSTVYKIVTVIIFVLLAYWVWKIYTHIPAQPLQYPAELIAKQPDTALALSRFVDEPPTIAQSGGA